MDVGRHPHVFRHWRVERLKDQQPRSQTPSRPPAWQGAKNAVKRQGLGAQEKK
jgi:hypothetical protein